MTLNITDVGLISKIMPDSGGEIWIWKITEDQSYFEKLLQPDTLKSLTPATSAQRRLQVMVIRYLLKLAGKGEFLHYQENGKPYLENGSVSISHTPALAGIYLTDHPAGMDIEAISDRVIRIARRFLNENERKRFGQNDPLTLTLLWSVKEAVYKKHGGETVHFARSVEIQSINMDLKKITVRIENEGKYHQEELSYQILENIVIVYTH